MSVVEDGGGIAAGAGAEAGAVQVGHVIAWRVRKLALPGELLVLPGVVEVGEPPVEVVGRGPQGSRAGHSGRSLGVLPAAVGGLVGGRGPGDHLAGVCLEVGAGHAERREDLPVGEVGQRGAVDGFEVGCKASWSSWSTLTGSVLHGHGVAYAAAEDVLEVHRDRL